MESSKKPHFWSLFGSSKMSKVVLMRKKSVTKKGSIKTTSWFYLRTFQSRVLLLTTQFLAIWRKDTWFLRWGPQEGFLKKTRFFGDSLLDWVKGTIFGHFYDKLHRGWESVQTIFIVTVQIWNPCFSKTLHQVFLTAKLGLNLHFMNN